MKQQFRPARSHLLPIIAFGTTLLGLLGTLVTAWFYGLGHQHGLDIFGFVLGTLAMLASLVFVAWFCFIFIHWPTTVLLAVPVGMLHGTVWASIIAYELRPVLANFAVPLDVPWIIGSICGLAGAAVLQQVLLKPLINNRGVRVSLSACLIAVFGPGLVMASCMLQLLSDDGTVQETTHSPDQRVTALVIGDDCGATCSCSLRVDLKTDQDYVREVYRSEACNASIRWQSVTQFQVKDSNGGEQSIDIHRFGLAP